MPTRVPPRRLSHQNRTRARGGRSGCNPRRACRRKLRNCIELPACGMKSRVWLGSFSKDPIGFAAGDANLYRYVSNSPTTHTDPSGLEEASIGPAPNPTPWWKVPFVRDPRSSGELQSPGMYHWAVGNLYWRLGPRDAVEGVKAICNDPLGSAYNATIGLPGNIGNLIIHWDDVPDLDKQDLPAKFATGLLTGQIIGQSGIIKGMPFIGKTIGMQQRLNEFYRRLRAQGPASSADDALARIRRTLDEVEDEMSGVTKRCPPPGPGMPDGRMYPPLDDYVNRLPDGRIVARSRGHRIEIGPNGETRITNLQTGGVDVEF